MKKAMITGGAGFIGYHLAKTLLEKNYKVVVLDNFHRAVQDSFLNNLNQNSNFKLINLDLLKLSNLKTLGNDYSFIYHFAAIIGVKHVLKAPYDVLQKNFVLLDNCLSFAKKQKNLKRFIFASTSEVYAGTLKNYGLKFPTSESTFLSIDSLSKERTSYMLSKIYGEAMCHNSEIPITIIRPHNFYGPRMGMSHVIPELMSKVFKTNSNTIDVFSVNHMRSFCFIKDAVNMICMLAESKDAEGGCYNIGDDTEEIKMGLLAKKIIRLMGKVVSINPLPETPGSPSRRLPDISEMNKIILYKKKFSIDQGLQETLEWYKKNIFLGKENFAV